MLLLVRRVAVGSGVPVAVGVIVALAVCVGGRLGTDKYVPGIRLLDCRQFAACKTVGLVVYLLAIPSRVSPGSTSICTQSSGMGQFSTTIGSGVALGKLVGDGVKVGSPGLGVSTGGNGLGLLVGVKTIARVWPPSVKARIILPKMMTAENKAANAPSSNWFKSLIPVSLPHHCQN